MFEDVSNTMQNFMFIRVTGFEKARGSSDPPCYQVWVLNGLAQERLILKEVSFLTSMGGGGLPKIWGNRYFFLDQKGDQEIFLIKMRITYTFSKETKYFVKHLRFQIKGFSELLGHENSNDTL